MTDKIEEVEVVSIDYLSEPSGSGLPRTTVAHQQGEEEFGDFQDDREIPTGSQVQVCLHISGAL